MRLVESADVPESPQRQEDTQDRDTQTRRRPLADLAALIRPSHAAKAILLVPVALIGAAPPTPAEVVEVMWATVAFMVASAAVYIGNDIADRHRDRLHPVKRHRPVAAGRVSVLTAAACCAVLLAVLAAVVARSPAASWPVLVYLVLNVAYTRLLKHLPLIDVGTVAVGFVLRVLQGYEVTGDRVPGWLLITVFSMSLLLLIGKRRRELLEGGAPHRPALRGYSMELTNWLLQIASVLALVSGLMYLRDEGPFGPQHGQTAMMLSTPFALFALFRYLQLQLVHKEGGDPVRVLLRDRVMVANSVVWAAVLGVTLLLVHL
ncbi:UbiA prenyltransferase family protein [Nonomuraea gerenzanensis]|uniref:Conserved membrane protein, possible 4-hydroxybenzoate octaprenyltranferase n=1 Tax=Nonomuraea gerenzanensis TaxID=93944 RepID=A0A1M4EGX0_9ACTN|nr:UbiA prenyltransferase family protein [Nonomuraea gerenzanensis]UBU09491.1 UbiA prenyltransferase family protein [Nonomuraea gerenzanensis]SBO97908.1 Conserved membrane protein, possible 4-hydroxybenzoate octaprenyltranferase [Nonomuraea gerenzanensis]